VITLGLDPSLTGFGWCIHDSDVVGPGRVVARGHRATNPKDIFVRRYVELRDMVLGLLREYPIVQAVGVESPPFGELWSEGLYGLFLYVNEAIYYSRKDVVFFDPVTLKFLVKLDPKVVKGRMSKRDMVSAARADTGITGPFNHNEADAYHIARFAARFWEFLAGKITESDLTPSEQHVFVRTHTYLRGKHAGKTVRSGTVYRENDRFFRYSLLGPS
jgi:hypothetical protein